MKRTKTYIGVMIIFASIFTVFILSTKNYNVKAENTKIKISLDNQNITSLKDITDTMIIKKEAGFQAIGYSSDYKENGFTIHTDKFTGVDYSKVIHADQRSKVTFRYNSTIEHGAYRLVLILNDKRVVEIPADKSKFTYEIPKGDTVVALAGYKAHGKLTFQMKSAEGVKFTDDSEWDKEEAVADTKDITSLKDITDKMILKKEAGFQAVGYSSNLTDNGFVINSGKFTGVDYSKVIHAKNKGKVTFKYHSTIDTASYKIVLIVNGDKLVELPVNKSEYEYELPKGDTIVALAGYKAHGKLTFEMNSVKGIAFVDDAQWD